MTDYMKKSFTVAMGKNDAYRDNWERTFGKKQEDESPSGPVVIENLSREELLVELRQTQAALRDAMEKLMTLQAKVRELEACGGTR